MISTKISSYVHCISPLACSSSDVLLPQRLISPIPQYGNLYEFTNVTTSHSLWVDCCPDHDRKPDSTAKNTDIDKYWSVDTQFGGFV
jgi:hypothetical protein